MKVLDFLKTYFYIDYIDAGKKLHSVNDHLFVFEYNKTLIESVNFIKRDNDPFGISLEGFCKADLNNLDLKDWLRYYLSPLRNKESFNRLRLSHTNKGLVFQIIIHEDTNKYLSLKSGLIMWMYKELNSSVKLK